MNYLVHLYLSEPNADCQLGNLMGDFVKGRLSSILPPGIRRGIELHRQVDAFAHRHPAFRRSKGRLDDAFGPARGILVDIFYDHFMACNWDRHSPRRLEDFAVEIYALLEADFARLPSGLQRIVPHMISRNWLVSYRRIDIIGTVLQRVSARLRRPNRLPDGLPELRRHYHALEGDFEDFLADAAAYVRNLGVR